MSSIDPQSDPYSLDINNQYAWSIENAERFEKQFKVSKGDPFTSDHSKVWVQKPQLQDAMKVLMGENRQRRWSIFQLPKGGDRSFLYESPEYSLDKLQEKLSRVEHLDCTCKDPQEQKLREQEKAVMQAFCEAELQRKEDYDALRLRILEFIQV